MASGRIERDKDKFIKIVKGKIKSNFRKYFTTGRVVLPAKGKREPIGILFPQIQLPKFRYGHRFGGVVTGRGDIGEDLGPIAGDPKQVGGEKKAGDQPGQVVYVEFGEEEILDLMELELNLQPKGNKEIESEKELEISVRQVGPQSRIIKAGRYGLYQRALKRQISSGEYDPENPKIIPIKDDKRYRASRLVKEPRDNALLAFMRDISGSIGDGEREIISQFGYAAEGLLRRQYDELETIYLVHHWTAHELKTLKEFLEADSYGGTRVSSVHELLVRIIEERFPPESWNIFPVYFSDGANWDPDNKFTIQLLEEKIVPWSSEYCYGEVDISRAWWLKSNAAPKGFSQPGYFGEMLDKAFKNNPKVICFGITGEEDSWKALEAFFGKKKAAA